MVAAYHGSHVGPDQIDPLHLECAEVVLHAYGVEIGSRELIRVEHEHARAAVDPDHVPPIVAIAGTDDARDVLDDLRAWPASREAWGIVGHAGALDHAETVLEGLRDAGWETETPVIVTGHSLGGAAAILIGLAGALRVQRVITYGAFPAVRYARRWVRIDRWEHSADVVPRAYIWRYRHRGLRWWIDRRGRVYQEPSIVRRWIDRAIRYAQDRAAGIHDHAMIGYWRALLDQRVWREG